MTATFQSVNKVRYLVLESLTSEPILKKLYEHDESPVWQYLFGETPWAPYLEESPIIVQASQDSGLYQWALKELKLNNQLSGIIIESEMAVDSVVRWAQERLSVTFNGVRKGLLRFYDPLIWHQLNPRNIGEEGPVRQVIYWHGSPYEGRWLISRNPEPVTMAGTPALEHEQLGRLNLPVVGPSHY